MGGCSMVSYLGYLLPVSLTSISISIYLKIYIGYYECLECVGDGAN
jgi:hypothetical protein